MPATDGLLWAAFADSPLGMAIIDREGHASATNASLLGMLGCVDGESSEQPLFDHVHADDLDRVREAIDRVLIGGQERYQLGARLRHHSGATVWVNATISAGCCGADDAAERPDEVVVQVEDLTENRRAQALLERRSLFDELTGLPNRTLLTERLDAALARSSAPASAVLFVDVDHFNLVNDSLGNEAGDTLLAIIAARLEQAVRPGDTVARLSGDEFVVLFDSVASLAEARSLTAVLSAAVASPVRVADHDLLPTVSCGLTLTEPGASAEAVIRDADTAMFVAKERGRARVEVFRPEFRNTQLSRLSIEAELRAGLGRGELVVHYQPVTDLATGEIAAVEALVRWDHPIRGLLHPEAFIEIAEDANLVVPLGSIVLNEACAFLSRHPEYAGRVFINVSTRQIGAADLARSVRSALESSGVDPARICLEITESGMLMATADARADLDAIVALGVELILDDFGTGYSAMSSVLQNPVSGLKLSREFTVRLGDAQAGDRISTAMASLVRGLGMYGVVEGIETPEQLELARRHGWHYGQGFLIARPQPEELLELSPSAAGRPARP